MENMEQTGPPPELKKIFADEATIRSIMNSEHQFRALKRAFDDKKISYDALGFWNKIKFGLSSLLLRVTGLFGDEEYVAAERKPVVTVQPLAEAGPKEEVIKE